MRLDHYLSAAGYGSRSEVKKIISTGNVCVDGTVCRNAGERIDENRASVTCDGETVLYREFVYYMLHKPAGVISASRADMRSSEVPCVTDLIKEEKHRALFPVGRLDKDTEGLLLITDDGKLAHELLSPAKHVDKTYFVQLRDALSKKDKERMEAGIDIGDETPTLPAVIEPVSRDRSPQDSSLPPNSEYPALEADAAAADNRVLITIHEGRFHQVKRMFAAVGNEVLYLKRLRMGSLKLDEKLRPGEYRELRPEEVERLKAGPGKKSQALK